MENKHRGLWFAALAFGLTAAGACGDVDEGAWVPAPGLPTSSISEPQPGPDFDAQPVAALQGQVGPTRGPDRSTWVGCAIMPAHQIETQVNGAVPAYLDFATAQPRVCMGEPHTDGAPVLCRQVKAFEAHAASVAACFEKMHRIIEARSKEALGEHWFATVLPLLPAIWSQPVPQIAALGSRISGGMVGLMNPGETSASGSPLCFPTDVMNPQLASLLALKEVKSLIEGTTDKLEAVTSALVRGIDVQVNRDFRLVLVAHFVEMPVPPIEALECSFESPLFR